MSEQKYQPKKGEEAYVHVLVSEKQGQSITPKVELYYPVNLPGVMGLNGFKGEIVYDPRTADQKEVAAPANDTVKSATPLTDDESYRTRYQQLFHELAPFNLTTDEVKHIVNRAEAQLANLAKGIEPIEPETDEQRIAREAKEAQAKQDAENGLPNTKTEWFALFQKEFPDDTTAYVDITVPQIRTKLGK